MTEKKQRKPTSKTRKVLADNIRLFRIQNELSQEELADLCDLHRTYIGSVERGERNVTLATLELLSKALNTSIPDLLTEKGAKLHERF